MKIGMCGVRGMGREFAGLFGLHPAVESLAIADVDAGAREETRQKMEVSHAVETLDQLLDLNLDSIGVFTPPWTHVELAVRALNAGKHVVSACPAGVTLDELRDLVDAVERTGNIYMIAETSYYYPGALFAREAWAEGRFGDFVYGEGEYYYRPHAYPFWMRDDYGNMPPMLYPTHSTTMAISVTGRRYERATCVGTPGLHADVASVRRRPAWRDNEISNMTMLGRMSGGGVCRINEMRNVGCKGEIGSLFGTEGSIRQHDDRAVWTNGLFGDDAVDIDLTVLWQDPAHHPQTAPAARLPASYEGHGMGHYGSHRFLADEFVRAVTTNRRPHNHVWAAASYSAPGIVAWESLKQDGEWLDVPDYGSPADGRKSLET